MRQQLKKPADAALDGSFQQAAPVQAKSQRPGSFRGQGYKPAMARHSLGGIAVDHEASDSESPEHRPNRTGLPDRIKHGVEALSGVSLDDVTVYYNSSMPERVHALAYAQGTEIHLGPGQERHLPEETWHLTQQKQGRVRPTMKLNGFGINDDRLLEAEAERMGDRAQSNALSHGVMPKVESGSQGMIQRMAAASPPIMAGAEVVQRRLEIIDQKEYFEKEADAEKYLKAKYEEILEAEAQKKNLTSPRLMILDEQQRLKETAKVADDKRYVYPFQTLKDAMEYIASGKNLSIQKYDLQPHKTPPRETDDGSPWGFALYKSAPPPTNIEVPQSPTDTYFPSNRAAPTPFHIDLFSDIKERRDEIGTWAKGSTKSHLGNNHYAYNLQIYYRLEELEDFVDQKGETSFVRKQPEKVRTQTRPSPYYTSKKDRPPQKKGDKPVNMEKDIRDELEHLHQNYDRDEFQKTSLFAENKGVRTKNPGFYKSANVGQISSLYFHSEVQAASDKDGAREVAGQAVTKLVDKAKAKIAGKKGYNLVVMAGIITGYSENRTVCGNACKPALADLSSVIAEKMTNELHQQRNANQTAGLYIRRSSEFRVSAHVGAERTFQGLETGAQVKSGTLTKLPHNMVVEYQPLGPPP